MSATVQAISKPDEFNESEIGSGAWGVLHVFEAACNLMDSRGAVLSLVQPSIGNGPFNIVVPPMDFPSVVAAGTAIAISTDGIHLGSVLIDIQGAQVWNPTPKWSELRAKRGKLIRSLSAVEGLLSAESPPESFARIIFPGSAPPDITPAVYEEAQRAITNLGNGLKKRDDATAVLLAKRLAGLGGGLTPAGDDFLMGILHAYWACLPGKEAERHSRIILEAISGKTGTLSSAWLRAAAQGKAGEAWHEFFVAIVSDPLEAAVAAARKILPTGHSSGADALAGFTFACRRLLS